MQAKNEVCVSPVIDKMAGKKKKELTVMMFISL